MEQDGAAVSAEDMQILASIIAERGAYDEAPPDSSPDAAPSPPASPTCEPLQLFPQDESPDPPTVEQHDQEGGSPGASATPGKRRSKSEAGRPKPTPWHFSIDLDRWSPGFATETDAGLAARAEGHASAWIGLAKPIAQDKRMIAIDALDLLGYRLALTEEQQTRFGDSIIAAAAKILGPAVRIEPKGVVDLNRNRPATFDDLAKAIDAGLYEERPVLFARDLAYVLHVDHHPIAQMLERYNVETIFGVLRTMYEQQVEIAS